MNREPIQPEDIDAAIIAAEAGDHAPLVALIDLCVYVPPEDVEDFHRALEQLGDEPIALPPSATFTMEFEPATVRLKIEGT